MVCRANFQIMHQRRIAFIPYIAVREITWNFKLFGLNAKDLSVKCNFLILAKEAHLLLFICIPVVGTLFPFDKPHEQNKGSMHDA